jgi:hypothetical protein
MPGALLEFPGSFFHSNPKIMFEDTITIKDLAYPMYVDFFTKNNIEIVSVEDTGEEDLIVRIKVERLGLLLQIGYDIGVGGFSLLSKYIR